jgi:hypothetical protein
VLVTPTLTLSAIGVETVDDVIVVLPTVVVLLVLSILGWANAATLDIDMAKSKVVHFICFS